ncbi:MAG: type II secretion system minor pseudopilin GspK [Caulobacter sp.]|nr:type II secretion system minor pseudopilin GspK [Caulobacter sp.]
MRPPEEKGVALLTVLLLVAVMSVIAVAVLDDVRFGLRRAANARSMGQAQWYGLGAEELARVRVARLSLASPERTTLQGDWNGRPFQFPVDHGAIEARISDAVGCFNLNSLAERQGDRLVRRADGERQFITLLGGLGLNEPRAVILASNIGDWIDTDDVSESGAEDLDYARMDKPYRTSGTLLSEVSEIRAVRGVTPDIYRLIRPYICALPTTDLSPINVNTLPVDRAILITMITSGAVPVEAAARLIAARSDAGWPDVQAFWNEPMLADLVPADPVRNQVSVRTRFFTLDADITFAGASATLNSLFELQSAGSVKLVARRWTRDE